MRNQPNGRRLSRSIRIAWGVVLGMLLIAAAWSLSGQLQQWGMRPWLAWPLSIMFDAAGLICATYARRAVERGTPAGLARIALLTFVSVAGLLNWNHGHDIGGTPAGTGFASLSAGVELLFELHRRDVRDEQRAARGLIAERLPHIPMLGWIMYPGRSWHTLRSAVGARLDLLDPVQQQDTLAAPIAIAPIVIPPIATDPARDQQPITPPISSEQPPPVLHVIRQNTDREQKSIADLAREHVAIHANNPPAIDAICSLRPNADRPSVGAAVRRARRELDARGGYR